MSITGSGILETMLDLYKNDPSHWSLMTHKKRLVASVSVVVLMFLDRAGPWLHLKFPYFIFEPHSSCKPFWFTISPECLIWAPRSEDTSARIHSSSHIYLSTFTNKCKWGRSGCSFRELAFTQGVRSNADIPDESTSWGGGTNFECPADSENK